MGVTRVISTNDNNPTVIKALAGKVKSVYLSNSNAALRYLKISDKATAPVVGTDVPAVTLPIPPGLWLEWYPESFGLSHGISYGLTTGYADNDTGAVAAGEIIGVIETA